jgi:DNA-binding GntR family transcriptional regulator
MHRREAFVDIWKKIKTEYISGGTSYRKLAEKYGVPLKTLEVHGRDEKWVELKRQAEGKAAAKIVEIESDKQAARMKRLLTVSDELLQAVEDAVKQFRAGELLLEKGALKSLSGAIKDIKDIQSIKSELDIEEQKARIAILKKQAEASDRQDTDIKIVIGTEAEEYSV